MTEMNVQYMEGGDPPLAPGLFEQHTTRIAWWPEGVVPTEELIKKVCEAYINNGNALSARQVRDIATTMEQQA